MTRVQRLTRLTSVPWERPATGVSFREAAWSALAFTAVAGLVYGWYVAHGGWYLDDWGLVFRMREAREAHGVFGPFTEMAHLNHRPGNAIVYTLLWEVGGNGQAAYNAAGAMLAGASGWIFYLVLRELGMTRIFAAAAGMGYTVLPIVDSARMWFAAYVNSAATILALAGLLLAIKGLRRDGRAAAIWHAGAVLTYAWATLTYELVAGVIPLFGILYLLVAGWRKALPRWAVDVAVVAMVLAYMGGRQNRGADASLTHLLDRLQQFPQPARDAFLSLLPFGDTFTGSLGALIVFLGAIGSVLILRKGGAGAAHVRAWLLIGALGFLFACAGWILLLPADAYFIPRLTGLGNRVSIVSGPGLILLLISLMALSVLGIASIARMPGAARFTIPAVLALTLAGMVKTELNDQKPYAEAWTQSQRVLSAVRASVGRPPKYSRFVTFHHPTMLLPADVSVFHYSWDLREATQEMWNDPTLDGHPYVGTGACRAAGWDPQDPLGGHVLRYGDLFFVDAGAYKAQRISSQQDCKRRLRALLPS